MADRLWNGTRGRSVVEEERKEHAVRPTLRLGRIRGIQIGVHWSLLVIGAVLAATLASSVLPDLVPDAGGNYWAAAILATALFFASVLAHELAHALVALRRGQRVEGITLWLLGGVASLRDEAPDPRSEFLVSIAGPATSFGLGALFIAAAFGLDATLSDGSLLPAIAAYLGIINVILAVFNLLPGAPLDGGRILSAALWAWRKDRRRAQITASRCGFVLGGLLVGVGIIGFLTGRGFGDLWTALVGWFVIDASRSEELQARIARSLDSHTVAQLMGPPPPNVPEWTTVDEVRARFAAQMPSSIVLTGFGGAPSALLQTGTLRAVNLQTDDGNRRVRDFAIAFDRVPAVPPDMPARAALEHGVPVVVVRDGQIIGVVGLDEVRLAAGNDALKTGA
jgi:Zn-dependent protease